MGQFLLRAIPRSFRPSLLTWSYCGAIPSPSFLLLLEVRSRLVLSFFPCVLEYPLRPGAIPSPSPPFCELLRQCTASSDNPVLARSSVVLTRLLICQKIRVKTEIMSFTSSPMRLTGFPVHHALKFISPIASHLSPCRSLVLSHSQGFSPTS